MIPVQHEYLIMITKYVLADMKFTWTLWTQKVALREKKFLNPGVNFSGAVHILWVKKNILFLS